LDMTEFAEALRIRIFPCCDCCDCCDCCEDLVFQGGLGFEKLFGIFSKLGVFTGHMGTLCQCAGGGREMSVRFGKLCDGDEADWQKG